MTLNQMKYFITVAECLSFTEAAKCLFITQPALSRQISAIEDELNMTLFIRNKKGLKLTPGGVILYNKIPKLMKDYNEIIAEAQNATTGFEGELRMGFLDVYDIRDLISPVLKEFQKKYPRIQVTIERYSLGELPQKLYDGKLDMILTYGFSLFDKPELLVENVEKFKSCIMLPVNHPMANKENLCLADLKEEEFVILRSGESEEGYNFIMSLFHRENVKPKLRLVETLSNVALWVEMGGCIAISCDRTVDRHNPAVVLRPIPDLEEHDTVLSWHKGNYNPAISLFMEMFWQIHENKFT